MTEAPTPQYTLAIQDFRRARRRAALQDILSQLTGRPASLLSYEEVLEKLKAGSTTERGVQEIPLDAIVGSVGRYSDFTRTFLPRQEVDEERWARLRVDVASHGILSPIKVYQIGEAYFVYDGNHRVSIARQMGASHILAHVVEVHTRVPLCPEDNPDDLIWKAEYTDFLERTHLDTLRPGADLSVTVPGQYRAIEEHIAVHRYYMGQERKREVPLAEAAADWYDHVYRPVVEVIGERGMLRDFPGRTETDLYVWIVEHRGELEQELGWRVRTQEVAEELVEIASPKPRHVWARLSERLLALLTPPKLQAGPPAGHWRQEHVETRRDDRLFRDILVALSGLEAGWLALEAALEVAHREGARLHGLHVVSSDAALASAEVASLREEFERRCRQAGIPGELAVEGGAVAERISQRARWVDLVVLSVSYPPAPEPRARLSSGLSNLLHHCPRPILTVPGARLPLDSALLAYDGSPKAEEALFVAAYLAGRWGIPLTVVTVAQRGHTSTRTLFRAERYLAERGVTAALVQERGPVVEAILRTAREKGSGLLIMGGYGHRPMLAVVLGSAVEEVLRTACCPLLICR